MRTIIDYLFVDPPSAPVDIVVPVSGGKDSQACLKLAVQQREKTGERIIGLFCDTKFEHPWTYEHVAKLESLYDVEILKAESSSVEAEVLKYKRFPGGGARHCTDRLKLRISKLFYYSLAKDQGRGYEVWAGVRQDESSERKKRYDGLEPTDLFEPHEFMPHNFPQYLSKAGIRFRLPVVCWSYQDVMGFLEGELNPLYSHGFERVGCFPCLAGGDASKIRAFEFDDFGRQQWEKVQDMETRIDVSIFKSNIGKRWRAGQEVKTEGCDDNPGCSFCSM